ncbi:MAG: sugar ABC transporter substrate-binding protein [Lachnospiraceae bacterium]
MKKAVLVFLSVVILGSMVACNGNMETSTTSDTENSESDEVEITDETATTDDANNQKDSYTFGYIAYDMTDIWNEYSANAFEYAATQADVPINTIVLDSKNSLEESITAMESLIQQEVDGISIFPISTEQGAQLVKMANEAGIPITVENFMMDVSDPGDYIATVACEYDQIGYAAIKFIAESKPGAKVFYCAGQEGAGVYEKYQEGVDRALVEYGDQVEVVAILHGDWLTDKAYNVTTDLISSGEEFDYIFANNGMMAQGCYQALKDADMGDIPIVSTGGSPDDYKMLIEGVESANMTAPVSIQGVQTFKNLYDYVINSVEPADKFISLPIVPVSSDKIDEFIAWDDYKAAYNYVYK